MIKTIDQAEAALATAKAAYMDELERETNRRDGSGAQECRREERRQSLREDISRCERDLEDAKSRQKPHATEVKDANHIMTTTQTPVAAKLDRSTWNDLFAKRITERAGWTHEEALDVADSSDDAFKDGDDPVEAADEELSNWTN